MSMNDPLGDMLTRIRNAAMRSKPTVRSPSSKMRLRVLEVLKDEGFIRGYEVIDSGDKQARGRDQPQVQRRPAGDPRAEAHVEAGPALLLRRRRPCRRSATGSASPSSRPRAASCRTPGRGPRTSAAKCSARYSEEGANVTHRKATGPGAERRRVQGFGPDRRGQGAEGHAQLQGDGRCRPRARGWRRHRAPARAVQARAPAMGHDADHGCQPGAGRLGRLQEGARDHRRRLSRRRPGQGAEAVARLQPRRRLPDPGRHRRSRCAKPTEIEITGIDQQVVGEVAAQIRDWRRPEPFKGKGVRYKGEYIFRKEGKKK